MRLVFIGFGPVGTPMARNLVNTVDDDPVIRHSTLPNGTASRAD